MSPAKRLVLGHTYGLLPRKNGTLAAKSEDDRFHAIRVILKVPLYE